MPEEKISSGIFASFNLYKLDLSLHIYFTFASYLPIFTLLFDTFCAKHLAQFVDFANIRCIMAFRRDSVPGKVLSLTWQKSPFAIIVSKSVAHLSIASTYPLLVETPRTLCAVGRRIHCRNLPKL